MHKYSYDFLMEDYLPPALIQYVGNIESSQVATTVKIQDYKKAFIELEKIARIQSIKSSNAIEGIITSDDRIKSIIDGKVEPKGHSEEEIVGYRNCLEVIHDHYEQIQIDEITIHELHSKLLELSMVPYAGQYKTENNIISEEMSDGRRTVRFNPPADETDDHMKQLILAYNDAISNPHIHRLILIPCFILDFLCIHPFQDGNGRISRLLTTLLLYKNGYYAGKYISLEQIINESKDKYYLALKQSSEKWDSNKNDYIPFMTYFLKILSDSYTELNSRFQIVAGKKLSKTERIERIVVNSLEPLSKSDICERLPDVSQTTIEITLSKLVKSGVIYKLGQGRSTKYMRN